MDDPLGPPAAPTAPATTPATPAAPAFPDGPQAQTEGPNAYGPPPGPQLSHYEIYDKQHPDKRTVGTAKTLVGARRSVDRRDNTYGAYRYSHRPVFK